MDNERTKRKGGVWVLDHEDEKHIVVTHINVRVSILFLMIKLLFLDLAATIFALVFFGTLSLDFVPQELRLLIFSYNLGYFLTLAAVKILLALFIVLQWLNEYYEITPTKIYYRRGIIWRKEDIHSLTEVKSIGVKQSLIGKIFNFGSLSLYDAGIYQYYYLNYIHNPIRYIEILQQIKPNIDVEKEVIRQKVRDVEIE